ncbi:unnamed protein product, partial [Allacma fusca]
MIIFEEGIFGEELMLGVRTGRTEDGIGAIRSDICNKDSGSKERAGGRSAAINSRGSFEVSSILSHIVPLEIPENSSAHLS